MKINILLLLSLMLFAFPGYGESGKIITIKNTSIKKSGNEVVVLFDMEIKDFPQNYKVEVLPVLYNTAGDSLKLPPAVVSGKKKNISDLRRGMSIAGNHVASRNMSALIPYRASVPFAHWMQTVSVTTYKSAEGCYCEKDYPPEIIADDKLLYYDIAPQYSKEKLEYELTELEQYDLDNPFLHAMEDYPKRYDILLNDRDKGTSKIIFKVGSSVIDMDIPGNRASLDAISKAFDLIDKDPNAVLKHIMIAGYASPEGSLVLNTRLGKTRADAVKKFIQTRMKSPADHLFELYNGREDWDGLRALVSKSSMREKTDVVQIIDAYTVEQEVRKTKLRQLEGGIPYKYMLEHFYPSLRTGGYVQVYYEIDRRATIPTSVTDDLGRTVWVDPDSPSNRSVTSINKAIDRMVALDFEGALELMDEFKDDPRSWNFIGVCHMMRGEYDQAVVYFERAIAGGDITHARKNIEHCSRAKQVSAN